MLASALLQNLGHADIAEIKETLGQARPGQARPDISVAGTAFCSGVEFGWCRHFHLKGVTLSKKRGSFSSMGE